jgi:hypothetical protein
MCGTYSSLLSAHGTSHIANYALPSPGIFRCIHVFQYLQPQIQKRNGQLQVRPIEVGPDIWPLAARAQECLIRQCDDNGSCNKPAGPCRRIAEDKLGPARMMMQHIPILVRSQLICLEPHTMSVVV